MARPRKGDDLLSERVVFRLRSEEVAGLKWAADQAKMHPADLIRALLRALEVLIERTAPPNRDTVAEEADMGQVLIQIVADDQGGVSSARRSIRVRAAMAC